MSEYKILNEESAKKYSVENLKFFPNEDSLTCTEIGDGNLNNIFRLVHTGAKKSLILKQALPYARTSIEMKLTAQRCKIEAMALIEQEKYSSGMVPKVYHYDEALCLMAMEDLTGYTVLRTAMMKQMKLPDLAKGAAVFFANTLIRTSDIVLDSKLKKDEVSRFKNKDLCELTENLVLTNPTFPAERNRIDDHIKAFIEDKVFKNKTLTLEFSKLKHKFMTSTQALLHGDAHIGSIFVNNAYIKFFDTEFSFYGPMGFDVGMFLGNLIMNVCYQNALGFKDYEREVILITANFIDEFKNQFNLVWDSFAKEHYAKNSEEFKSWYLEEVLKDTAGYCGCEMLRRTTGSSHVKEMDEYEDKNLQIKAQMNNISMALELILNQSKFTSGADYLKLLEKYLND